MHSSLNIKNLTIWREKAQLISLNERIKGGEVLSIMGPSGSGKSTLLNWLTGMLPHGFSAQGTLLLNEQNITQLASHQRHVGLLYQDPLLFPHLNVADNIAFAMPKGNKKQRIEKINNSLTQLGLEGMAARHPHSLSGGQQARVALLRVLLSEPKAILLDEPFSKLDATLRKDTRELVFEQIRQRQLPAVMVTHDDSDAHAAGGKVITLSAHIQETTC